MNWDLILGYSAGIFTSVVTLIGTFFLNKQKYKHDLKRELQSIVFDKSFKEYELKSKESFSLIDKGHKVTLYPYDMYLVTYSRIADFLNKGKLSEKELNELLIDMDKIRQKYDEHNDRVN